MLSCAKRIFYPVNLYVWVQTISADQLWCPEVETTGSGFWAEDRLSVYLGPNQMLHARSLRLTVCSHPVLCSQTSPNPLRPPVHLLLDSPSSLFLVPQSLKLIWHLGNRCCNKAVAKMICTCMCTLESFPPLSPCFTVFYCLYMDVTVHIHTTSIKLTS